MDPPRKETLSEEDIEKWTKESADRICASRCSSNFEVLDPHDPTISRLATQLFKKTNDYLQSEMAAGQEHYSLLEEMNRVTISKYTDLRNLAVNLTRTMNEYDELFNRDIKPLLDQIDQVEAQVSQFETKAYRLDQYTAQLHARFKALKQK